MPITTQSSDGQLHQFPDGTPDTVVDKAMADYTSNLYPQYGAAPGIEAAQGLSPGVQAHLPVIPTEAAKGIPIAGAYIPSTPDTAQLEQEHPTVAAGTRAVGGALAMAPAIALAPEALGLDAGASMLTNTLRAAGTGGALSAADTGARGGSWKDVGESGVTGALTGAALPAAGKAIGAVFQGVLNALGPEAEGALKGVDPKALSWASDAAKSSGLNEQQIAGMIKEKGPEAFLAEYSPQLKGAAQGVTALPGAPEGKAAINAAVGERGAPQAVYDRINQNVTEALGEPQNLTQLTLEGVEQRGKDAGPLFEQFKDTKVQPTPEVKALTQDIEDKLPGLFNEAKTLANAKSVETGKEVTPMENFFTTGERKDWPTTESWQRVKEAIDQRIASSYTNGQPTTMTGTLVGIKKRLDNVISNANPEAASVWKQARDTWGDATSIMKARDAGTNAWNPGYTKDQMAQDVTELSQPERNAYKEGARASLAEKMNKAANGDVQVRNMFIGPEQLAAKQKLSFLAGNKNYDPENFFKQMEQEKGYADTGKLLKDTTQQEATRGMMEKMTPNPEDLAVNKLREKYSPHIQPFSWGTAGIANVLGRRQAAQYEAARNALGPLLATKGPQAQDIARALLQYNPRSGAQAGMNTVGVLKALAQPNIPNIPILNRQPQ